MQTEVTIHQHVVPQTWLKHFTYNPKKSSFYMFDKQLDQSMGSKNKKNVAGYEYFYDFHEDVNNELLNDGVFNSTEDNQYVEKKFFSYNIEDKLGKLLKSALQEIDKNTEGTDVFNLETRASLSVHIAVQFFRTDLTRQFIINVLNSINKYAVENKLEVYLNDPIKEKEVFHYMLLSNSKVIQNFTSQLFKRKWVIYKTRDHKPFVISDNPVVLQKTENLSNICVPLSKNYLLVMYDEKFPIFFDNTIMQISPQLPNTVDDFNNLQYHQCKNEIYSSIDDFSWIDKNPRNYSKGFTPIISMPENNLNEFVSSIIERKESLNSKE